MILALSMAVRRGSAATTAELLPERIDLVGFVLQIAGLFSLLGLVVAIGLGKNEAQYAKNGTVLGAGIGLFIFLLVLTLEEVP